jgi:predicted nucleotidyltransferase
MGEVFKDELDKHVKFISSLTGVLQIYLFGSYANGEQRKTSDVDLMIIIENSLDPFKTAYRIRKGLTETDLPIDIVVNRKSAFEEASKNSSFQKSIMENGVLLYAA